MSWRSRPVAFGVVRNEQQFQVTLADGKTEAVSADALLVAIGRKPNTGNLGIEGTKVELDRGFVKVDPYQRTGEPGVYAIGDIVSALNQISVAVGHAAIAATVIHNRLPRNFREDAAGQPDTTAAELPSPEP